MKAPRGNITMDPSSPVIEIHGDDVMVEAGYLAARLGLSVARLRAEMRRGIVYSVVERGMGEDAGRLRLTVRYRARAWTVVVQRDGAVVAVVIGEDHLRFCAANRSRSGSRTTLSCSFGSVRAINATTSSASFGLYGKCGMLAGM